MPASHPRVLLPETGDLSRVFLMQEFDSMGARAEAYKATPEERSAHQTKFDKCLTELAKDQALPRGTHSRSPRSREHRERPLRAFSTPHGTLCRLPSFTCAYMTNALSFLQIQTTRRSYVIRHHIF
jgi:hypothetical protein